MIENQKWVPVINFPHIFELVNDLILSLQEILFTIENKKLFVLQTRTAKRTPRASVQVAVSMVKEKMITEREALLRVDPNQMDFFLHSMLTKEFGKHYFCNKTCFNNPSLSLD